jgi:hypothetical protein
MEHIVEHVECGPAGWPGELPVLGGPIQLYFVL